VKAWRSPPLEGSDKMSIYISRLTDRSGIRWPPLGEWMEGAGLNQLETFARNLDVSNAARTDLLNSVPTPWARLLLFEAALYDAAHPAHQDVVEQWRGLLGVVALYDILRLRFDASRRVDLRLLPGPSRIRDAFLQLRPRGAAGAEDDGGGEWHYFSLTSVDGHVLGATSPRTLVFTGISHACPESVPFRTEEGRLYDPLKYYMHYDDPVFLGLMARWLDSLIRDVSGDAELMEMLGAAPGAHANGFDQLVGALNDWRDEFPPSVRALDQWPLHQDSPFEGVYSVLRPLRLIEDSRLNKSDLYLRGRQDTFVFFRRGQHSALVNRSGMEINNDKFKIYDGHWAEAGRPLPTSLSFLPALALLEDPAALFEDSLIEAPLSDQTSYALAFEGKYYLLPYKKEVLDYFAPEDIVRNTSVQRMLPGQITVELTIPLVNDRAVRASKNYREDDEVIALGKFPVANLAFWPNFVVGGGARRWERYFYYKYDQGRDQLDFKPLGVVASRNLPNRTWSESRAPLRGFIGTVDGRSGLLLVKYETVASPTKSWKVAIDLGSTHTRAFYLEVENRDGQWLRLGGIMPVKIEPQVKELTECLSQDLSQNFFVLDRTAEEFMSQLVMPQPGNEDHPDWLPREGLIYQKSLLEGFPANVIKYNFKWNSNTTDYALRAYIRCLLVLVQAEALREGARVVSVGHAFPSVFTPNLEQKHRNEWAGLGAYSGLTVEPPLMESVAVGRYLQVEQGAAVSSNTIALDVGGSTTDIAIWASNSLNRQESVKMAAGVAGRYVQTEPGPFKQELVRILAGPPFNMRPSLDDFRNKESGFTLMFNAVLNRAAEAGALEQLVESIQRSQEGKRLIAHIMYVYGTLLYYAGMLGRKVHMGGQPQYYVYFCGKGGRLVTWVNNHHLFVREMFSAGLLGAQMMAANAVSVSANLSDQPKQEVGRGLLVESMLTAARGAQNQGGLIDLNPPKVTVGEEGYGNLHWDGDLDGPTLAALPQGIPAYGALRELNGFVRAFTNSPSTCAAAALLGLGAQEPAGFRDNLRERLFGNARGRIVHDLRHYPGEALLESLFITEAKILLETVTNNPHLFS
jgi:hypothetical protein